MRFFKTLLFSLRWRLANGSRISTGAYLKGHERIRLGRKCKIHDAASLDATRGALIDLGDQVTINRYAYLQGDRGGIRLGNRVEINNFTIVNGTGGVVVGDDTLIGPGVRLISYQHGIAAGASIRSQPTIAEPIRVGSGVWIGANAVVLAGVTIGDGAVIGAGAVVTRDVAADAVVAGVPARVIKNRA
ncbi:MAG: acyltransferase [Rhodocyclales bacterium]|nr:acyltransferase [Rhodocyclales bacterium]